MDPERGATLGAAIVIRVWFEGDGAERFRARVTYTTDPRRPGRAQVVAEPDQVLDAVRDWLRQCVEDR